MKSLRAVCVLLLNFLKGMVMSGGTTAWIILRGGKALQPGFVRMSFAGLGPAGASLLGALINLTPGTTTVDINLQRQEFLLHLLDTGTAQATLASIERDFLAPVRILFGGDA